MYYFIYTETSFIFLPMKHGHFIYCPLGRDSCRVKVVFHYGCSDWLLHIRARVGVEKEVSVGVVEEAE